MMLVLPVASSRILGVEIGRCAAADQADIEGQVVLGQLAAEVIDDPRQLIDRAIAGARR